MRPHDRRPDVLQALLLAVCLLAAQWGGGLHRVEHGAGAAVRFAAPQAAHAAHAADLTQVTQATHQGHEPGTAECLLIDHALAHADAWLPGLALAFAALRQAAPEPMPAPAAGAAAVVVYLARGPPAVRA